MWGGLPTTKMLKHFRRYVLLNKKDYNTPIREQVYALPEIVDQQLESCFNGEKLHELMSMAEIFDVRKLYVVGCGDSWVAGGAMQPVLTKYCDCFGCTVMDPMQFTRFTSKQDIGIGEPNSPLVIGISAGGGTARVVEAMQKAAEIGAFPLLLTQKSESRAAKAAKRVFNLETPMGPKDSPGLKNYFGSLMGLITIACRMGHVRGVLPPTAVEDFKKAISSYVKSYADVMDKIDDQMFELAKTWKDFEHFDFIGDGTELYSAIFGLEKFYECTGVLSNYDDSEDWCHIDFFCKNPEKIGTVFMVDVNQPSTSRIIETIGAAVGIGRPTLVVTNGKKEMFPEGANVVELPETPEGFEWLMPLMDYVPVSLLAGYCSSLAGRRFFNSIDPETWTWDNTTNWSMPGSMTIGTSKIEIHA